MVLGMEAASLIVNGGIFVATVIAGIIAWKQATIAIDAKKDAIEAQNTAKEHADAAARSATAGERSAEALEKQASLAEAAAARVAAKPWSIAKSGNHRWKLTNDSGMNLDFVLVESDPKGHLDGAPQHVDVKNGGSVSFGFGGGMTDPTSVNIVVSWRSPLTKMAEKQHFTI